MWTKPGSFGSSLELARAFPRRQSSSSRFTRRWEVGGVGDVGDAQRPPHDLGKLAVVPREGGKGGGNLPDAKAYHTNECTIDQPNEARYTNTECKEVCGTCFLAKDAEGLNGRRVQIGCPIIGCNGVRVWKPSHSGSANGFFCAMCLSLPGQERERIYHQRELMRKLATTKQATSDAASQMEGKALEKAIKIWEDVVHKYWDSNTTGRPPDGSLFLDYPGVSPIHCFLKDTKRARYTSVTDEDALNAYKLVTKLEKINPSLEPSHAFAEAIKIAPKLSKDTIIIVNSCGDAKKDRDILKVRLGKVK